MRHQTKALRPHAHHKQMLITWHRLWATWVAHRLHHHHSTTATVTIGALNWSQAVSMDPNRLFDFYNRETTLRVQLVPLTQAIFVCSIWHRRTMTMIRTWAPMKTQAPPITIRLHMLCLCLWASEVCFAHFRFNYVYFGLRFLMSFFFLPKISNV
jgi:hypothetical protein